MSTNTDTCRSCGHQITWAQMKNGRPHPFDATPTPTDTGKGYRITPRTIDGTVQANYVTGAQHGEPLYVSHFATCPNAAAHRSRGAR